MTDTSIFTLNHYKFSNGVHELISSEDYDDFDSAWVETCGPNRVYAIPNSDYSSITETIVVRVKSNSYDLPDDCRYIEEKPMYFMQDPNDL